MRNLGKIALLLLLLTGISYAGVVASVEPQRIYAGDTATYTLTLSGDDIKKPVLSDICGNQIVATGSQTSIQSINGDVQKSYILKYDFVPFQNCTIDVVEVEIGSKIETSNSVNVVVQPKKQDLNAEFILDLQSPQKELYVGEPFELTLLIKQRRGAQGMDSKFFAPSFQGFWIKSEGNQEREEGREFITTKIVYKLAPQREGNLTIEPAQLKIASRVNRNTWGTFLPQVKWKNYYSNSFNILAKPLPNGAKLVGDFQIAVNVSQREVNPNEAVNVSVEVLGEGNLEDIESFKPYVKDVNVFDEKININGDRLSQKLVFVGERDFTIPAFALVFFNIKTKQLEKIHTEPIKIKVSGDVQKSEVKITRDAGTPSVQTVTKVEEKVVLKNNYPLLALALFIGIIIGVAGVLLGSLRGDKKVAKVNIKDEKVLLMKLLPYKDGDADVASIVTILENNIYTQEKEVPNKKLLKSVLKRYNIV